MADTASKAFLIASGNAGKVREFGGLLAPLGISLVTLARFPDVEEPEETGSTFRENSILKAAFYARETNTWAIADDSGLEVDHLGGRPGVFSARYGGQGSTYAMKIDLLLAELEGVEDDRRGAQFVSCIALADPSGLIHLTAEGICRGSIAREPLGTNGFGYDPIFIPNGFEQTFAEMSDEEKRSISHRGKAASEFIRKMSDFTGL